MTDKLIITGLDGLDGEYECDFFGMLTLGHPECLTNREGHGLKTRTGVTPLRIVEAIREGDNDVSIGLAAVVLRRKGHSFDEDALWDAKIGEIRFEIGPTIGDVEKVPPTNGGPESGPPSEPTASGGEPSPDASVTHGSDPSPTGDPPLDMSAISAQEISEI